MLRKSLLTSIFFLSVFACSAQSFLSWQLRDRYWSVFAGTGWTGYMGELTHNSPMSDGLSHWNAGIEARLYSRIGARVSFARYTIDGTDKNATDSSAHRQRNLSFVSKNWEWQFQVVYYFLKYNKKYHARRTYEPYLAVGFGQTFFNPQAELNEELHDLRPLMTENVGYKTNSWIIPVSLGLKAKLNEFLNLSLDLGYRFTFSGYLDDVSNNFGGPYDDGSLEQRLSNRKDEIAIINREAFDSLVPGAQRGDGTNDGYFLINLNIELYLPRDLFKGKNGKNKKEKILGKPSAYD